MRKQNKKGFTIVELVIVIAVIAILVAVMVPTFVTLVRKAQVSNDRQLIKNLNTALTAESVTERPATMTRALEIADDYGYNITKINAKASGNQILWDELNNVFCYLEEGNAKPTYIPEAPEAQEVGDKTYYYWKISKDLPNDASNKDYSIYYTGIATEVTTSKGFDAGTSGVTVVNYSSTVAQNVTIRTNGAVKLVIDAPNSHVEHYDVALEVAVNSVSNTTYVEHGQVGTLTIGENAKNVVLDKTAFVTNFKNENETLTLTNNGYIVNVHEESKPASGVAVEATTGAIKVYTFEQLQSLALASAVGGTINGKTIQLQNDIDMTGKAWVPFGFDFENAFTGTIDGNNKTIKGMTYTYTEKIQQFKSDSAEGTPYGLISYAVGDVTIENLTVEANLDDAKDGGEGISCFVGVYNNLVKVTKTTINNEDNYVADDTEYNLTFDNCTAKGSLKGKTKVGGFVGSGFITQSNNSNKFAFKQLGENARAKTKVTFKDCTNEANVSAARDGGIKVGGFAGCLPLFAEAQTANYNGKTITTTVGGSSLVISGTCINKGTVEGSSSPSGAYVAIGSFCGYLSGSGTVTIDHSKFKNQNGTDDKDLIRATTNDLYGPYVSSGLTW